MKRYVFCFVCFLLEITPQIWVSCFTTSTKISNGKLLAVLNRKSRARLKLFMTSVQDDETNTEAKRNTKESSSHSFQHRNLSDIIRDVTRGLAELSLKDYKWRSSLFKEMSAEQLLESSLARMRGESPSYVRPMDASELGPLGRAEESAVTWLSNVIEEEGKRAQLMVQADGALVRPIDVESGGPLAEVETLVVRFFDRIRVSEQLRNDMGILRPKDLDESQRGPLGDAEHRLYQALKSLASSETLRFEQSLKRGGNLVRPMDIPGPIGEVEAALMEIIEAEKRRVKESAAGDSILRPMNAEFKGPLGEAELETIRAFRRLSDEERERLRGILKKLRENRPMETNRQSLLGFLEALVVGMIRFPQLLAKTWDQAKDLLKMDTMPLDLTSVRNDTTNKNDVTVPMKQLKTPVQLYILPLDEDVGEFE
mmetsp:Transcript_4777/g.5519  ORF Transcript_4777/g.5519 Transcript_4777/m.5519 type:complete len:426 (+) Transcript_4777:117-1394(+)